jgi:hypothetical protein
MVCVPGNQCLATIESGGVGRQCVEPTDFEGGARLHPLVRGQSPRNELLPMAPHSAGRFVILPITEAISSAP